MKTNSLGYLLTCTISIFLTPFLAWGTVIHVPVDYPTIGDAVVAASDGDTVLVAAGTYNENIDFDGKDISLVSQDGPEVTIIESQFVGTPIVLLGDQETSDATLRGFKLQLADNAPAVRLIGSSPAIVDNIFLSNNHGAIEAASGAAPVIENNVFINNEGPGGGGVYCDQSAAEISSNLFISNSVSNNGGGVYLYGVTGASIHHNIFYLNQSHSFGGAIGLNECQEVDIFNNTIASNSAEQQFHGGGIGLLNSENNNIYNNIVTGNTTEGIYQNSGFTNYALYNDVWNNTLNYSGIAPGDGSISVDPLFVGGVPFNFHLQIESPCIDAGDPTSPADPDGSRADMGAYYYVLGASSSFVIGEVPVDPEMTVELPIFANRMEDLLIGGLEFHLNYDTDHLAFTGFDSDFLDDATVNDQDGSVHIIWDGFETPIAFPDSSICISLNFDVSGEYGDTCGVNWSSGVEIVDTTGIPYFTPALVDGFVYVGQTSDIEGDISTKPVEIFLMGNYPNPFNSGTVIKFSIADDTKVTLDVYDILGRRVDTIANGRFSAGSYSIPWNPDDNPSGIYFYRVNADGNTLTGIMTLLR